MEKLVDITTLRKEQMEQLRKAVKRAYNNRRIEHIDLEEKTSAEAKRNQIRQNEIFKGKTDEDIINLGKSTDSPHQVTVTNPHDYGELIAESLRILAKDGYFPSEVIARTVEKYLKHEFEHHTPALGQEGLGIRYGVAFVEDKDSGARGMFCYIKLDGTIKYGVWRDVIGSATEPSATDKIALS